jgi:hypothetical protein
MAHDLSAELGQKAPSDARWNFRRLANPMLTTFLWSFNIRPKNEGQVGLALIGYARLPIQGIRIMRRHMLAAASPADAGMSMRRKLKCPLDRRDRVPVRCMR